MLRLLQLLFLGHFHKWKNIREVPSYRTKGNSPQIIVAKGTAYVQQCEHCGKLKEFDTLSNVDMFV